MPHTRMIKAAAWLLATAVAGAGLAACSSDRDTPQQFGPTPKDQPPSGDAPAPTRTGELGEGDLGEVFTVQEVTRFDAPWALAFVPGASQALVTERTGVLHLVDTTSGDTRTVAGVPEGVVVDGQGGLGDVITGPDFANTATVFLSYVRAGTGGTGAVVARARLSTEPAPALHDIEVLWEQNPKTSGSGHFGHRLALSPDGESLIITSGDRQKLNPAQDRGNDLGTIIELDLKTSDTRQLSYGHRNPLGVDYDVNGRLWVSEMGPRGGDELNLITPDGNYGWPLASNGSHYDGRDIPDHTEGDGFVAPVAWWTPSISPGSLEVYTGDLFDTLKGDALLGALSGEALVRVRLCDGEAVGVQQWRAGERIRAVREGPSGAIWLLEDAGAGRLLKLTPK